MIERILTALSTRRCKGGCAIPSTHTHHLTAFGRWRYTGRWSA